jgi:hypothetical protein
MVLQSHQSIAGTAGVITADISIKWRDDFAPNHNETDDQIPRE